MSLTRYTGAVYGKYGLDLFSGDGRGGATRADLNARDEFNPAVPLENLAERAEMMGQQEDPLFEQALAKGLREQASATVEQVEQSVGLTGAAQVGAVNLALLEQTGQAAMAAHARRVENERAMLNIQTQLLGQAGQLREQRYETNQRHQEFLMQLKAQQDAQPGTGEKLLGAAAGIATAFATGGGSLALGGAAAAAGGMFAPTAEQGAFLGGAQGRASSAATSQFGPMAGLQGFFGALGSPPSPAPTATDPDPFDPYNLFGFGA
jgi:hypothetical protein